MKFVDFTGEETEQEFLEKCLKQWDLTLSSDLPVTSQMMQVATVFSEMRHRVDELE